MQPFASRTVDGIRYRLVAPSDAAALEELALKEFCGRMPLYQQVGATSRSDVELSMDFLPKLALAGESLVAEDAGSGQLVGARLSAVERRDSWPPSKHPLMVDAELQARYPKESIVMRAADATLTAANYFGAYSDVSAAMVSRMLAVRESHGRRGIGRRLQEFALELAPSIGAQLVVGLTQSYYSQRIYEDLQFERVYAETIPDYVDPATGDKPFAGLAGTVHQEAVSLPSGSD
ncbi:hypothetical protein BOX15_Mlig007173g3 [Macrostomum lignano]|uniref:Uncharacterized protein n=1 Tax=Macrostomum lignano TaxID=282301 RepID=A0A267FZJ8_9PLAT|nr:hypothetical protein BOX15_Mlig007173g3 [Macrostomum lignano]